MIDGILDAQATVLGAVLIDDSVAGEVIHRTREEDYTGHYRSVYKAIKQVFLAGKSVDPASVAAVLGPGYEKLMLEIMQIAVTSANVSEYIQLTLEQAQLRRLREAAERLAACHSLDDARALLGKMNRAVGDRPSVRIVTMAEGVQDFYERQQTKPDLLEWGFSRIDRDMMIEKSGDFTILGGYPSAGKTALSVQMAWTQAKTLRIGYFSLETKPEKLIDRTVSMVTGIDFGKIKRHQLEQGDWTMCSKQAKTMSERNLDIIQAAGMSVADIQALTLAGRYDVIYIDYLQLVRPDDLKRPAFEQVSQISMDLHTMAQTTKTTVVALSQLTRPDTEGGKEKAPTMHSLRQSGQIEQDADAVMLLYKDSSDTENTARRLKIAKNKEGEAGWYITLKFDGAAQRFTPVETRRNMAAEYSAEGKAIKQKNHVKQNGQQSGQFVQLTVDDPNNPWPEGGDAQ